MPHLRRAGPESRNGEVVLRFGDRLQVTPSDKAAGWRVTDYPAAILRLDGSAAAASSHTFEAVAVGRGQISMASAVDTFTVGILVMRDNVQRQRP